MKVVLISMPDVIPIVIHEMALHMPNHGIASVGANIDEGHEVYLADLVRKRSSIRKYLTKIIGKIKPDLVGLSAMTWQYDTCIRIAHLIKELRPEVRIAIGGYHATLLHEEIGNSEESKWFDFMIRGEGEEACRRLVNALDGHDDLAEIPSLSYKKDGTFIHNPQGENLDLSKLKLPIRDKRRLTRGYHFIHSRIELIETSRGCTRSCNFCSMRHMYGRTFRTYPINRVLEDIDDIYTMKRSKWIFITDDNMVLNPSRVVELCDAIIAKGYKGLNFLVQADCVSMATNETMVERMARAGFRSVFLGIENGSVKNLRSAGKGDILAYSKRAIDNCHRHGMMVIGGLIFGFAEDDESSIAENYAYFKELGADAAYCQILTPYPKTAIREQFIEQGLLTNTSKYKTYNGLWANVRTKHLDSQQLQFHFWYQRQVVLGWWNPPASAKSFSWLWTSAWRFLLKPFLKIYYRIIMKKYGWEGRYQKEVARWERMNHFTDLEQY